MPTWPGPSWNGSEVRGQPRVAAYGYRVLQWAGAVVRETQQRRGGQESRHVVQPAEDQQHRGEHRQDGHEDQLLPTTGPIGDHRTRRGGRDVEAESEIALPGLEPCLRWEIDVGSERGGPAADQPELLIMPARNPQQNLLVESWRDHQLGQGTILPGQVDGQPATCPHPT